MAIPNIATITASLERSLQNFSLNHQQSSSSDDGGGAAHAADSPENPPLNSTNRTLELNSEAALPYHWEQCLDLETGEIYYINWKTGMRSEEDPRTTAAYGGDYYSEDDVSSGGSYDDDSEGSSTESSPCCSREQWSGNSNENNIQGQGSCQYQDGKSGNSNNDNNSLAVLVVAGCKGCFMYYMVPKQNAVCPKCCGQLIHFDRSENGSV